MNEFNPNCGRCGMLNSRGYCSLTACRYPTTMNMIVVEPTAIRDMMVQPQREKPMTNAERIRAMNNEELARFIAFACQDAFAYGAGLRNEMKIYPFGSYESTLEWLKQEVNDAKT